MASYKLTQKADEDLANLYEYGVVNFGIEPATSYLIDLQNKFRFIVDCSSVQARSRLYQAPLNLSKSSNFIKMKSRLTPAVSLNYSRVNDSDNLIYKTSSLKSLSTSSFVSPIYSLVTAVEV